MGVVQGLVPRLGYTLYCSALFWRWSPSWLLLEGSRLPVGFGYAVWKRIWQANLMVAKMSNDGLGGGKVSTRLGEVAREAEPVICQIKL